LNICGEGNKIIKTGRKGMLTITLGLSLALLWMGLAQAKLTENQKKMMKEGKVKELAWSLTWGAKGRVEKIVRLYLFVRDDIRVFQFKERRSSRRILMDGASRPEDKARLLSDLLYQVKIRNYLATINLIRYGEDQTFSFVALRVTWKEAEALSRMTGGNGKVTLFPIRGERGYFIPLVSLPGYSIGRLSTDFYQEVKEGSGKWKKWKYGVSFAKF